MQNSGQQQQQSQEQPIYLFVSRSCKHCPDLIAKIQQKAQLAKLVQVVSVENVPKLPDGLTKVPALVVKGKVLQGNNCFQFVINYGELGASPTYSNSVGFQVDPYSYIGDDSSGAQGNDSFSFIGERNGSAGIDPSKVDQSQQQESHQRSQNTPVTTSMNMDALEQQRRQEFSQFQNKNSIPI